MQEEDEKSSARIMDSLNEIKQLQIKLDREQAVREKANQIKRQEQESKQKVFRFFLLFFW